MNTASIDPAKPSLLFISPVFPDVQGNGLAMRSGMFLEALAACYNLDLLIVPIFEDPTKPIPEIVSLHCRRLAIINPHQVESQPSGKFWNFLRQRLFRDKTDEQPWLWMYATRRTIHEAGKSFAPSAYDAIHVFRLYMFPFTGPYLKDARGHRPAIYLDLDDIESVTHTRLAKAHQINNEHYLADFEQEEALRYERAEREILSKVDQVYVCSESDCAELAARYPGLEIQVIPNAVRLPSPLPAAPAHDRFTLLFVGTLGYYPNLDAVRYFSQEILPLIQQKTWRPVEFWIVGNGTAPELQQLAKLPGIKLVGQVTSVSPYYQQADLVVAPLRTGGGTRIKVLEAFAHRRPLVSTTIGIEGIDAKPGTHLLVGDSPEEFATECLHLLADHHLQEELIQNAYDLVCSNYTMEAVAGIVSALHLPSPHP